MSRPARSTSGLRYCLVGAANAVASVGLTAFLHEVVGAPEEVAYAVTLVTLFVLNFFANRHYIYQAADGDSAGQFGRFLVSSASFRLLEYGGFLLLHSLIGVHYLVAVVVVKGVSFAGKFLFYRAFVFVGATGPRT